MSLRFATVCSGIGAPECAWAGTSAGDLGWKPVFCAEIEPFPSAVLAHHHPDLPNHGDLTKHNEWPNYDDGIDLICGGTPCQAFSVAGLRKGLDDPRGNLTLTFLALVAQYRPRWVVWENVPGVLSDRTGAFGSFLGGLGELGYGFAYRILDAQYFGVAQRRRRVFVVAHAGGQWQRAAAVLFERASLRGDPAPRRKAGKGTATTLSARAKGGGGFGTDFDLDGGAIPIDTMNHVGRGEGHSMGDFVPGAPSFTITKGHSHAVAHPIAIGIDGTEVGYSLRASASHSGDKGDGGVNTTMVAEVVGNDARSVMMRGREGCAGGGKGPLLSEDKSLTLAANANDQVLFQPTTAFEWQRGATQQLEVTEEFSPALIKSQTPAVAHSLRGEGWDASKEGTGRGTPLVPEVTRPLTAAMGTKWNGNGDLESSLLPEVLAHGQGNAERVSDGSPSRTCNHEAPIAFLPSEVSPTLSKESFGPQKSSSGQMVDFCIPGGRNASCMAVRRLTPRECERLQGFPDDYTLITHRGKPAADGPRYKALGNSMAVPVMRWIGERIALVEQIEQPKIITHEH